MRQKIRHENKNKLRSAVRPLKGRSVFYSVKSACPPTPVPQPGHQPYTRPRARRRRSRPGRRRCFVGRRTRPVCVNGARVRRARAARVRVFPPLGTPSDRRRGSVLCRGRRATWQRGVAQRAGRGPTGSIFPDRPDNGGDCRSCARRCRFSFLSSAAARNTRSPRRRRTRNARARTHTRARITTTYPGTAAAAVQACYIKYYTVCSSRKRTRHWVFHRFRSVIRPMVARGLDFFFFVPY